MYSPETGITKAASQEAVSLITKESEMCESTAIDAETLAVLKELVRLHANWDKGSAYVPVKFMNDNNEVIERARAIIARAA